MIGIWIVGAVAGALLGQDLTVGEPLTSERFYIIGWSCEGRGCSSTPRDLGNELVFDEVRSAAALKEARHLAGDWQVGLQCRVFGDRLERCNTVEESTGSPEAAAVARTLVQSVRLKPVENRRQKFGPSAILIVRYVHSGCPHWRCTPVIPPPPPPPPRA